MNRSPDLDAEAETDPGGAGAAAPRSRSRLARRRRVLLGVGAAAALLSLGGLIGAAFVKSPAQLAADAAPPPATVVTAKVTDQVLTSSIAMCGLLCTRRRSTTSPRAAPRRIFTYRSSTWPSATR